MSSASCPRAAAQDDAIGFPVLAADAAAVEMRAISAHTWLVTRSGRIIGSIRQDHEFLVFDAEGMLAGTAGSLTDAERRLAVTEPESLSYSVHESRSRRSVWGVGLSAAVLIATGCAIAAAFVH